MMKLKLHRTALVLFVNIIDIFFTVSGLSGSLMLHPNVMLWVQQAEVMRSDMQGEHSQAPDTVSPLL